MKAFLVLVPIIAGSLMTACAADPLIPLTPFGYFARGHSNVDSESSVSSGIDPITQAGIDASNQANDDAVMRQNQWATDQANQAAVQAATDASNAANAAAAAAAAAAANQ